MTDSFAAGSQGRLVADAERDPPRHADAATPRLLTHEPFIGHLAHALRSALNGIRGWSGVIDDRRPAGPAGAVVERAVAGINHGVDQQVRLIDAVCDACEILAGRRRIHRAAMRMRAAIELAIDRMRGVIEDRGIEFVVDLGLDDETIDGDRERIVQVLEELLRNAARCTPANGRIRLTAGSLRGRIVVAVEDNGRGLPDTCGSWLFDPFRASDCGGNIDGHLGLGLPVAKVLVTLHDGTIDVRSAGTGRGTTVTVVLPLAASRPHPA